MAVWVAKVSLRCSTGSKTAKLIGPSSAEAIRKGVAFDPMTRGPSCVKVGVHIVQRGAGAGAPDRFALGAVPSWWPFGKKKPAKRHPMTRTVYMMKTKSGSYIPVDRPPSASMAGARRRKRKKRR